MIADWPQIDHNTVASSSDLFGGELFGDELMDMYSSVAVVGSGTEAMESIGEIPNLLPTTSAVISTIRQAEVLPDVEAIHPGGKADAIDDGLGAFRPSTSFNDFSHLLSSGGDTDQGINEAPTSAVKISEETSPESAQRTVNSDSLSINDATKSKKRAHAHTGNTVDISCGIPVAKKRAVEESVTNLPTSLASTENIPKPPSTVSSAYTAALPLAVGSSETHSAIYTQDIPSALAINNGVGTKSHLPSNGFAPSTVKREEGTATPSLSTDLYSPPPTAAVVTPKPSQLNISSESALSIVSGVMVAQVTPHADQPRTLTALHDQPAVSTAIPPVRSAVVSTSVALSEAASATRSAVSAAAAVANKARAVGVTVSKTVPTPPEKSVRNGHTTEADFKSVAQQAVNNLILNAGTVKPTLSAQTALAVKAVPSSTFSVEADDTGKRPVDTSTAHIAALTSSNWVAACSASVAGAPPGTQAAAQAAALAAAAVANDPALIKENRAKRANLTPDERARQNRDRNREHARNTRLRKKAYVEELKRTLTELVAQRDAHDLEKRHESQRDLEVREVRFRVMEEFLKLRAQGGNAALLARWVAILEEGFTVTLPKTKYETMVDRRVHQAQAPSSIGIPRSVCIEHATAVVHTAKIQEIISSSEQVLKGAAEVMEDAAHFASFLNTLGNESSNVPVVGASTSPVSFTHFCDRKQFLMDGVNAVLEWTASTNGLVAKGAQSELVLNGTMQATFNAASNKLVCGELLFDTGVLASQHRKLSILPGVAQRACDAVAAVAAAAQMTASEADALLDSIQMPQVTTATSALPPLQSAPQVVFTTPGVVSSAASVTSSEKGDSSSDESIDEKGGSEGISTMSGDVAAQMESCVA